MIGMKTNEATFVGKYETRSIISENFFHAEPRYIELGHRIPVYPIARAGVEQRARQFRRIADLKDLRNKHEQRVGYKDNQEQDGKHCHRSKQSQKELAGDSRYVPLRVNHIFDKRGYRKNTSKPYRQNENAPKYRIYRAIARQKFDDIDLFAFIRYVRDSRYYREYLHQSVYKF